LPAHPLMRVAQVAKAVEEKALEGRTPTRVRFDDRSVSGSSAHADDAMTRCGLSFPFPEVIRTAPLRRAPRGIADTEKPLEPRRSRVRAEPGNGRRGEAPRGVPRAGRSKTLKGEPHGRWAVDGSSSGVARMRRFSSVGCGRPAHTEALSSDSAVSTREDSNVEAQGARRREGTQTLRA
jgi:hypothetical protein